MRNDAPRPKLANFAAFVEELTAKLLDTNVVATH